MSFSQEISRITADVEKVLEEMLPKGRWDDDPSSVGRYSSLNKGKRLRPFLTVQSAGLFDTPYEQSLRAGTCIEMLHNFSLIHDDLPCIDNDKLRNGRPSAWAQYGYWQAVLGGDGLLNWPYHVLATDEKISADPAVRLELIRILSEASHGMLLGEYMDTESETGRFHAISDIDEIQILKTGQIFLACTMFGATLGHADEASRAALQKFTQPMGLCFQVTDDILDAIGDEEKVGKTLRKDAACNKANYILLYGVDGARKKAAEFATEAKDALSIFDHRADGLRELMDYMPTRES
ncbi:MAG: polyprenyl synthetase family protein [Proteobacteria bacterium]|nr:polyprenyl synthetase family protein [Pseudomonadota bacterium]